MESKYTVKYSDDKETISNYYFKFTFIERIFDEDTDDPALYTIMFGAPLQPEAKQIKIFPHISNDKEMAVQTVSISMPDGGSMTCPYDMEKKELLIDEPMWEVKGRRLPVKREYVMYNESIKALIEFLRNEYIGRKIPIKPKFIDKNIVDLVIVGEIKDYDKEE